MTAGSSGHPNGKHPNPAGRGIRCDQTQLMNAEISEAIAAKMRAGGVTGATIDAFLAAVAKVAAGERGQITEATIEPAADLPTL